MVRFYKYQAAGNDFIILPEGNYSVPFYSLLCDRHFGIGADGILIPRFNRESIFMEYRNSDGKVSSFCGNGSRAFALYLKQFVFPDKDKLIFSACDGKHSAEFLEENLIKVSLKIKPETLKIFNEKEFFIDSGSPHYVIFVEKDVNSYDDFIELARRIRYNSKLFPSGTNVNIVKTLGENTLQMRTYERGVEDETLSCGTGTIATAYIYNNIFKNNSLKEVKVITKGGTLYVSFADDNTLYLSGPAEKVFKGSFDEIYFNKKLEENGMQIGKM